MTLLYRKIQTLEALEDQLVLQNNLRRLQLWAAQWSMRFNAAKCYIMSIHCGLSHRPYFYELCNTVLTSVADDTLGYLISVSIRLVFCDIFGKRYAYYSPFERRYAYLVPKK